MSAIIEDIGKLIKNRINEFNTKLISGDFNASVSQDPSKTSMNARLWKNLKTLNTSVH